MKLCSIVGKDMLSRKKRVLYATFGVVIGTMTLIGILSVAWAGQSRIQQQLEKYGPNLTIIPSVNNLEMNVGALNLGTLTVGENYISQDKIPEIRKIADGRIREGMNIDDEGDLATIAPQLYVSTEVKGAKVLVVGIDPSQEPLIKTWWRIREGDLLDDANHALVGATASQLLDLGIGDTLTLGQTEVAVTGILEESGSNDDLQIFVPLALLQKACDKDGLVSAIDVRALCNACPVEHIAQDINSNISGIRAVAVKQVAQAEMGMMERINQLMLSLAGITILIGLFAVTNSMTGSVHERIKDIGIMRAVGASSSQIVKMFLYEAVVIGIIGGSLGYAGGTLLAFLLSPLLLDGASVSLVPGYYALSLGLATSVAVIATIYPTVRATRIKVADSFRSL